MKSIQGIELSDVNAVYDGWQRETYELIMGRQIHVGGLKSSRELADLAGIEAGHRGVDLCCGSGASMRWLVRSRGVRSMIGVDATKTQVANGRAALEGTGLGESIRFVEADACHTGIPDAEADFIWSEDAWCYVIDKEKILAEAVRIVRPGGTIAFTDWIEGPTGLADAEAEAIMRQMTIPSFLTLDGYRRMLEAQGCEVVHAEDTGFFAPAFADYAHMLDMHFGFDALEILEFNEVALRASQAQLAFMAEIASAGKLTQGRFIARKP